MWSLLIGLTGIIVIAVVFALIVSRDSEGQANITGIIVFIGYVALIIGLTAGGSQAPRLEVTNKTNIVCIKDNSNIHGGFFLFGGSINQDPCYYYYEETDRGGYLLKHVMADTIAIFEDAPVGTGYLSVTSKVIDPVWEKSHRHWLIYVGSGAVDRCEFHVPPNSISRDFKLDAE